jgi:hypothetical protein
LNTPAESCYDASMNSDPLELKEEARAEYFARWEAVDTFKAHELAAMTEERAREIMGSLGAPEGWRERPDWSGLVEQQAIFHKKRA